MRARDLLWLSWRQLSQRRGRTLVTVLAVSIGVVVVVALTSITNGIAESISSSLMVLGPNTIVVTARGHGLLTDADIATIYSLEGVESVVPMRIVAVRVSWSESPLMLVGVSSSSLSVLLGELKLSEGELYPDIPAPLVVAGSSALVDEQTGEPVAGVGQTIAVEIGGQVRVLGVAGILSPYGMAVGGTISIDDCLFAPSEYVKSIARGSGYNAVLVKTETIEDASQLAPVIKAIMRGRARVLSVEHVLSQASEILGQINALLVGIASASFVAAGLGTLNIMMVSVLERTREIGVLKALGMRDSSVLLAFLVQGAIIGALGSAVGLPAGGLLAHVIAELLTGSLGTGVRIKGARALEFEPVLDPSYALLACMVSIAVALVASAYPAWRAARLDPVDALRYE